MSVSYTPRNIQELWIDPYDYQDNLEQAVEILAVRNMPVSIYNHQLMCSQTLSLELRKEVDLRLEGFLSGNLRQLQRSIKMWGFFNGL